MNILSDAPERAGSPILAISPVAGANGRYSHWVSVQRDVTAPKQAEAEREQLIATLQIRNAELDAYNHSVAHDLRNPIISIFGLSDMAILAIDAEDLKRTRDCISKIARCAGQADVLMRSLMALDDGNLIIEVCDNGVGIDAAAHGRIFDLFERASDRSIGTGVGLALVDRAAGLLHGEASLGWSRVGEGSCFVVRLPQFRV
jgi:signal transduction histidine kinase